MILFCAFLSFAEGVVFNSSAFPALELVVRGVCGASLAPKQTDDCPTPGTSFIAPLLCDAAGNLVRMQFLKLNCTGGSIPSEIGLLSKLATLDVRDTGIGGTLPRQLAACTALTVLLTSGNFLYGVVPAELASLVPKLIACTLMRRTNDTNCFSCPIPDLPCTSTLSCNNACPTASSVMSRTFTQAISATSVLQSTTSESPTTTFFTTAATTTKQTDVTTKTALPETVPVTQSSTDFSAEKTTTATYQMRTFTHGHLNSTFEDTLLPEQTTMFQSIQMASDGERQPVNVPLIVALICSLVVAVPLIVLLACLYRRERRRVSNVREQDEKDGKQGDMSEPDTESDTVSEQERREIAVVAPQGFNFYQQRADPIYDVVSLPDPASYDRVNSAPPLDNYASGGEALRRGSPNIVYDQVHTPL